MTLLPHSPPFSPPRHFRSLLTRFVPLLLLLQVLLFGATLLLIYLETRNAALRLMEERLNSLKIELTAALQGPILERDLAVLREISRELIAVGEIDYLIILNLAGEELARAGWPAGAQRPASPLFTGRLETLDPSKKRIDVAISLPAGQLFLGYSPEPLFKLLTEQIRTSALFLSAFTILTFLFALLFFRRIANRLAAIEKAAAALAAGRLDTRAPAGDHDEIERLGSAFNAMADALAREMAALTAAERETQQALDALEEEHAHLTALLEAMRFGVLLVGSDDRVLYANTALRRLWRIPPDHLLVGTLAREAMQASQTQFAEPEHFSRLLLSVPGTHEISDTTELHLADGRILLQLCYPVRDFHQRLIGRLWLFEDITLERRNAEQLIYLAERDGLTGLYNRRRFEELLEATLAEAQRNQQLTALLLFDLDEFKHLNDTFGHRAGDALLVRVAGELTALTRKNEIVARLGGDEFALLIPHLGNPDEAGALAERIVRSLARIPFDFDNQRIGITVSVGVALFPDHADNPEDLIIAADVAMYQAKNAGRNTWRFYDGSRNIEELDRLTWNQRIERALAENLFELHYQGIYRLDGTLKHVEALIRMRDPEDPSRLVAPGRFIPVAEKSGKIRILDRWVIQTALTKLQQNPLAPPIAVNISAKTLSDPDFPLWLEQTWTSAPPAARRLIFEITETAAIGDLQEALRFADLVHRLGAVLCLDDFGTGFSSFSYLKYIPADTVKIDGQFIKDLPRDRNNYLIVQAIAQVARGMGKTIIAEFVEDSETLQLLSTIGVDAVQGYYLGRPSPDLPANRCALPSSARPAGIEPATFGFGGQRSIH